MSIFPDNSWEEISLNDYEKSRAHDVVNQLSDMD